MTLVEMKLAVPRALVEAVDEALVEAGATEWSLYDNLVTGEAWLNGVFPHRAAAEVSWQEVARSLPQGTGLGTPLIRDLPDTEWRDSYKAHFKAWRFGRLHWVPIWQRGEFQPVEGESVLWLDPGLAFGTGNHETTRLVVERLVEWDRDRETGARKEEVIDAGCGSGILALSAARLGYSRVQGFDVDPEAVRVSQENASSNGLGGAVEFFVADLEAGLAGRSVDLLMANIQADVLIRAVPFLTAAVAPGGFLVLSGILRHELAAVRAAFENEREGWLYNSRTLGDWSDLQLYRNGRLA